jgi:uncharacterized protein with von Willebrand factor type A (vWA) domain
MTIPAAIGFVEVLRRSGIPVAVSSALRYQEALAALDPTDPDQLYWAGRATLVLRPEEIAVYDGLFAAYWGGAAAGLRWRPPVDPPPLTVVLDDGDEPEPSEVGADDDAVTVRWSAVEVLGSKDFADYSEAELEEARRLMARLAVGGELRAGRRRRAARRPRGAIDLRRTVRRALRSGGEPLAVARVRPTDRPRRLVLLLDVSGSMEPYARALLRFVQAAVAARGRVEAFALGTRLTRLPRELATRDPDRALAAAAEAVTDWSGGTRLGDGLAAFNDEWGCRGMARGATVVILSDGWDRGDPDRMAEQMARLHRVAHRVVWVNPLKALPGYQPLARGMAAALPYVDDFVEGHCLDALEQLAALLLAPSDRRRSAPVVPAGTLVS